MVCICSIANNAHGLSFHGGHTSSCGIVVSRTVIYVRCNLKYCLLPFPPGKKVACSYSHTVVVTEDDQTWTFGDNQYGQLGHGDKHFRSVPAAVPCFQGAGVISTACGVFHTVGRVGGSMGGDCCSRSRGENGCACGGLTLTGVPGMPVIGGLEISGCGLCAKLIALSVSLSSSLNHEACSCTGLPNSQYMPWVTSKEDSSAKRAVPTFFRALAMSAAVESLGFPDLLA